MKNIDFSRGITSCTQGNLHVIVTPVRLLVNDSECDLKNPNFKSSVYSCLSHVELQLCDAHSPLKHYHPLTSLSITNTTTAFRTQHNPYLGQPLTIQTSH